MGQDIDAVVRPRRTSFKPAIVTAISAVFSGTLAHAQDWAGWYAGASLGAYSSGVTETERVAATNAVSALYSYTGNGVAGAVYVGHNWQQEKSVYGVEIGLRTGESADLVITPNDRFNYETDLIADIKVRYGYAFNPDTQVFASAGASLGNLNYNWVSAGVPETGSVMSRGYTLGVGVERLVGGTGAVRLSVDYHSRRSDQFQTTILPGFLYENEFDTVTLSVGYSHFFAR